MTLAQRLDARRRALKLTHQELADRVGVSRATVTAWCGRRAQRPRHEYLLRLAEALHPEADRRLRLAELLRGVEG